MATLEDIAKKVGVSKSTVSKALTGAADVSDTMRRRVLDTAVELGYSRLRRSDDAQKLAVFIANMDYIFPEDFGYDILVGFRKLAEPEGFAVETVPLTVALEEAIPYETYMMEHNYRGAFFLGLSPEHPWRRELETCRIPTVLCDDQIPGNPHVTYVGADSREGMHQAVEYLAALGHRQIGYLSDGLGSFVSRQRHQAFFDALEKYHLPADPGRARADGRWAYSLRENLSALLNMGCTAIVCSHDALADQVLACCRDQGIAVPGQLSIVGFDDLPLCTALTPALTTIRQDRTMLGKSAYCALSSQLEGVSLSTLLLHTKLIPRGSCAAPRQK